jgi:phage terminase large subunit
LQSEAYRLGRIYNEALVVPEVTGGWGHTVVSKLEKLGYRRIYTTRVEDRLKKRWTDKLGWDTTARSRALMLDTLEEVIREREFILWGHRTFDEMTTFVRNEKGKPEAQPGRSDDLVISLAIGVLMARTMPREVKKVKRIRYEPQFAATGY